MESLKVDATAKTPQIDFNHLTGELVFSGKSIPENSAKLYEGVLKWIKDYAEQPNQITNFRLNLEYFNTSSVMWIAKMVKILSSMKKTDGTLMIHFYFDIFDFESMDLEEIADTICPIIGIVESPTINIGLKIYGINADGEIFKENLVFI